MSSVSKQFIVVVLVLMGCGSWAKAAKLTMLEGDPAGDLVGFGQAGFTTFGPRYGTDNDLLELRAYNYGGYLPYVEYATSDEGLYHWNITAVADPTYYPLLPNIASARAIMSASMGLGSTISGIGGVEEESPSGPAAAPSRLYDNYANIRISGNANIEVNPVTWCNNVAYPSGPDDNETIILDLEIGASTHNTQDSFAYYRIDPVFNESVGDPVPLDLGYYFESELFHHNGNEGYTGGGLATHGFTINGEAVDCNGGQFTAAVGDIIGVQLGLTITLNTSPAGSQVTDSTINKYMLVAATIGWVNATVAIPPTNGCSQYNPIMPQQVNPGTNTYVFDAVDIGASGLGIDDPVWFDPENAIGYDLTITGAGGVLGLSLPDLGHGGTCRIWYDDGSGPVFLSYIDGDDNTEYFEWQAGGVIYFPHAVNVFGISSIDMGVELDPSDPLAFPVGMIFDGPATGVLVTMTPTTVPEPMTLGLLAMGGLTLLRRRHAA